MWYSSGTVSVTSGGTTVNGSGTNFIANVRVGDGITIQGSTSLHEVVAIASPTQLTIRPAYPGTSGSGRQFACAPILGYDKDLSDAFNQLRLEFGDRLSSLQPWAYAATANQALIDLGFSSVGRSVATGNAAQGRSALGLGTAATLSHTTSRTDATPGRALRVADFGLGATYEQGAPFASSLNGGVFGGLYRYAQETTGRPGFGSGYGAVLHVSTFSSPVSGNFGGQIAIDYGADAMGFRRLGGTSVGWGPWRSLYHSGNTTVDSNGFIKSASPVLKLHADRIESNSDNAPEFHRLDTGHYQLTGCNGLRLGDGWYIETPHDRNKNPYFNVEWEQDVEPFTDAGVLEDPADVTLTIRCYERVWNPATGTHDNGDPVDIPEGRWIDLRMNEVRVVEEEVEEPEPTPEPPSPPAEPEIPSVVPMASAKLALLYADLYEPVEAYIEALPEPHRTAALIEWNHRQTLERDHPLVAQAVADGVLTEGQLDALFADAAGR